MPKSVFIDKAEYDAVNDVLKYLSKLKSRLIDESVSPELVDGVDVSNHASRHLSTGADPISGLARSQLEYPTENVPLIYLLAIDKTYMQDKSFVSLDETFAILTLDSFTDKAIKGIEKDTVIATYGRWIDTNNMYRTVLYSGAATADFSLRKVSAGVDTILGTEAVDITADRAFLVKLSISGSSLSVYRTDMTTAKISVTDTTHTSGKYGVGAYSIDYSFPDYGAILEPPASSLPKVIATVEYQVKGSGKVDDPIRPAMPEELVEVSEADVTPEEWIALQANPKGPNGLPLVNKLAVSFGAIDYKGEPTMVCAIYGSSPSYVRTDTISRHVEAQRAKAKISLTPPFDIGEIHRRLRTLKPEMLITENELAYQLIGSEELEAEAIADFYEREVLNLRRIEPAKIPDFDQILQRWAKLAEKHKRHSAKEKIDRIRRR